MYCTRKSLFSLASAVVLMLPVALAHAATIRNVPSTAYHTIQSAIDAAATGDTIVVAAGTYHESLSWGSSSWWINKDLYITGAGAGASIIDPSVASGGPGGRCLMTTYLTSASWIDGFTFQNGSSACGAGMYNLTSSPNVTRCIFASNSSPGGTGGGGGMCNAENSNPYVSRCDFLSNASSDWGGGMHNIRSNPTLNNCTFLGNSSDTNGGGIYNEFSDPTVANCFFRHNSAYNGAGMYNFTGRPIMTNCTFSDNWAWQKGAGMYNYQNSAAVVANSIFWGGMGGQIYNEISTPTFTYSDIQGLSNTTPDASGNFSADPLFVDAFNSNLRLMPASPCRDRGNNTVVSSPPFLSLNGYINDLDGNARIAGNRVDLGVYEWHPTTPPTAYAQSGTVSRNTSKNITLAGYDPYGNSLTYSIISYPSHGTLSGGVNTWTYTPAAGYVGPDSFTFRVADTYAASSAATVTITVN